MTQTYYEMGFKDGFEGKDARYLGTWINLQHREEYNAGYVDGKGEYEIKKSIRAVTAEFAEEVRAPLGFEYTGEKRVANPGEWYVTKNGNAKQQIGIRGNAQTRHILRKL